MAANRVLGIHPLTLEPEGAGEGWGFIWGFVRSAGTEAFASEPEEAIVVGLVEERQPK